VRAPGIAPTRATIGTGRAAGARRDSLTFDIVAYRPCGRDWFKSQNTRAEVRYPALAPHDCRRPELRSGTRHAVA
jgi:hypothetical protein